MVAGAVMYPLLRLARRKEWCRFVGQDPHEYKVGGHLTSSLQQDGGNPTNPQLQPVLGPVSEEYSDLQTGTGCFLLPQLPRVSIILEVATGEVVRVQAAACMQAVLGNMAAHVLAVPFLFNCFCWAEAEHMAQQGDLELSDTVAVDFWAPMAAWEDFASLDVRTVIAGPAR